MTNNEYMYLFCREDLSPCQRVIQTAHAAALIGHKYHGDTYATLCGAKDEEHLKSIADYLDSNNIAFELFFEPDIQAFTAIATAPLRGTERLPLKKFKLMM